LRLRTTARQRVVFSGLVAHGVFGIRRCTMAGEVSGRLPFGTSTKVSPRVPPDSIALRWSENAISDCLLASSKVRNNVLQESGRVRNYLVSTIRIDKGILLSVHVFLPPQV
jgi:hypothetical protein